jgi:hypothetical protein
MRNNESVGDISFIDVTVPTPPAIRARYTGCNVLPPMIDNDHFRRTVRPDLAEPTMADSTQLIGHFHMLPKPIIEARAVSNAVLFLASERGAVHHRSIAADRCRSGCKVLTLGNRGRGEAIRAARGIREGLRVRFVGFGHAVQQR